VSRRARLHALVDRFGGRRVLAFGDLVLDRFVLGTPKRISREAPVIILRFEEQRDVPGGGANAMANVAALGGRVLCAGVVGDDEAGRSLVTLLAARGIDVSSILAVPGFRTVTKVRVLAGSTTSLRHQVARYDVEDTLAAHEGWHDRLSASIDDLAKEAEAAAISDYGYGVVTPASVSRLRAALRPGALTVADSRFSLAELGGVDGVTPNLEELAALTGEQPSGDRAVAATAENLRRRLNARFVVATRGSQGLTLVEPETEPLHLPVYGTDQVADVTGAGDTVLATLTLALAAGASPREAATLANLAAGIVVTKMGTATVSSTELHEAVDRAPFLDS